MLEFLARQRQLAIYLAGGVLSALIDIGLMQTLIVGGTNYVSATTAGFIAGLLFNFGYHALLTFSAPINAGNFVRYLCVVLLNYGLTLGCVGSAVWLGLPAVAGKLVALPLVAASGFELGRRWIFRDGANRRTRETSHVN